MPELLAHVAPVDVNLGEGSDLCMGEVERCAPPQREQVLWSGDKKARRRAGSKSGDCSVVQETCPERKRETLQRKEDSEGCEEDGSARKD